MALPRAARFEDELNRRIIPWLRKKGWRPKLVAYTGYGSPNAVRVLGRVVMHNPAQDDEREPVGTLEEAQRGWRSFVATPVPYIKVTIRAGDAIHVIRTDRSGYIDATLTHHHLDAGWHDVSIKAATTEPGVARVNIVAPETRVGLVSDIDDTVMITYLPRALIAAWNTFVRHTTNRRPVPGMAQFYRELQHRHPGMPVFYLSTGAWGVVPTLHTFLQTHGYPEGAFLMTDWGPTNTGWFRSGLEHKRTQLRRLAIEFPDIEWFLVGDDGQHDPLIYDELAKEHPAHVRAVLIRQLNPVEQVLAHGTPSELRAGERERRPDEDSYVPYLEAPDGHRLAAKLRNLPEA